MTEKRAEELFKKHRLGTLTEEEKATLESWYLQHAESMAELPLSQEELEADLATIERRLPTGEKSVRPLATRRAFRITLAAASILLFITAGIFYYQKQSVVPETMPVVYKNDVAPGDKKAVLTLEDNTRIILDGASLGNIARQTGITVSKTANGHLLYIVDDKNIIAGEAPRFNTISTPRGGEYQVQLSDGTVVWLNAMSSIRFPTSFTGAERRVELSGEAYFEVAKNKAMPFRVVSGRQVVEVLGTHFNIAAYRDEQAVKTTLLEGSVKVYLPERVSKPRVLQPGEQAVLGGGEDELFVIKADLEEAVAWKNGYFIFADEELETIMRKISRWYDVEVEYQGIDQNLKFGGAVSRSRNLSQVLDLLELTDKVKFKVEGRRITVMR